MYLRLAFSVAINMNPDVLLADEVLAVGDLEFQERCLARVAEASRQGITVLFVSHDMAAISRLCTRGIMLNGGELVKDGTTDEIVELYQEAAWTRVRRKPRNARNESGELLFVKLTSPDGQEIGAARWAEDVCITYGFRIDTPGVFIRPACDVFARGVLAFRALEPQEIEVAPGFYTASLRVPGGLLAETIYSVNAAIDVRLPDDTHRPISDFNALTFRVYDVADTSRGSWRGKMPGVVAPRLEWTTVPDRSSQQRKEKLSV
jgi:lipopolysaccharide transport system ATP-binding protein